MALQTVNIGTTANDGTGDQLRVAFDKLNDNFNEVYTGIASVVRQSIPPTLVGESGDIAGMIAFGSSPNEIYICTADYNGSTNVWFKVDVAGYDTHVADSTLHYTQASISITESQISDLQSYALELGIVTDTGTARTLALTDAYKIIQMNNAASNTVTVPLESSVNFDVGTVIEITQYGAGQTSVVATGGVTINSLGGNLNVAGQHGVAILKKVASDEWLLSGDLTA